MDNRRDDYRFAFPAHERLAVECQTPPTESCGAEIVDLSVTGMRVQLHDAHPTLAPGQRLLLKFALGHAEAMTMPAVVVHRGVERRGELGVRFLPVADVETQEAREKALWVFLLEEQRKSRRRQLA